MLICFISVLTLACAAYLAFRLRQFQQWKSESELCAQMQREIDQLKSMVSDMVLDANKKAESTPNQESDSAQPERDPEEEA